MNSSLVNSLAKVYDPKPLHGQKPGGKRLSSSGLDKAPSCSSSWPDGDLRCVETRMDSLSSQMEQLLGLQETVLTRLDLLSRDLGGVGREVAWLREGGRAEVELRGVVLEASERVEQQGCRLEGVERLVEGMQQIISFLGDAVKSSRVVEMLFKKPKGRVSKASRKVSGWKWWGQWQQHLSDGFFDF